ncbi:F-box protein SKIP23-like [Magnolia sinica]|uniref:F-box protein SKIP23-like n=1 Tax=Magnolia sinica TaxID=86752 RepID=UPI002657B8DA|nr:F-box protein SKIP23-like [Magnolia sinica]
MADRVVDCLELEKDILELILMRLRVIVDFINFGAVCKTWRSVFLENRHRLSHLRHILIIPSNEKKEFQDFFRLSKKHFLTHRLEENGKWCVGSSEDCLIMIDFLLNISLVNPFTKTETPLPRLTSLSDIFSIRETGTGTIEYTRNMRAPIPGTCTLFHFTPKAYVQKAVMAGPYVFAILGYNYVIGFCRRDSYTWTHVGDVLFPLGFDDLVCYNGNFYAVDKYGHVVVVDVSGPHPTITKVATAIGGGIESCKKYLVESYGELLMVGRRIDKMKYPRWTYGFLILRVDLNKHVCFPLEALGDRMLFLGENQSMSLFTRDFPGCERNCIYFIDEHETVKPYYILDGYLRVYNLEFGSIKPLYKRDWNWNWLSQWPICFTPKPW